MPEKPGFTFVGWEISPNSSGTEKDYTFEEERNKAFSLTMGEYDVYLTANWTEKNDELDITDELLYLTYNLDGGSFEAGIDLSYGLKSGEEHHIPQIPTKEGNTFAGWKMVNDNNSKIISNVFTMGTGNQTLLAKWNVVTEIVPPTGKCSKFVAGATGIYKIELWGAAGDGVSYYGQSNTGGKGGYTAGNIELNNGESLYVCVGSIYGFNGGGAGGEVCQAVRDDGSHSSNGSGGGATDVRLYYAGKESDITSLKSRIMVAGGGGGNNVHCGFSSPAGTCGSAGGGLSTNGATQTSGNQLGLGAKGDGGENLGTKDCGYHGSGGGGGGYYGGKRIGSGWPAGGGGSSYISGHSGCTPSSKQFTDIVMIDGSGYLWPSNSSLRGKKIGSGHKGNGEAKISLVKLDQSFELIQGYQNVNVIMDLNGGEINDDFSGVYKRGDKINLGTPTRTGYSFKEWKINIDTDATISNGVLSINSKDIYLSAQWYNGEKVNVYIYPNGGSIEEYGFEPKYERNQIIKGLPVLTRKGYIFAGWEIGSGSDAVLKNGKTTVPSSAGKTGIAYVNGITNNYSLEIKTKDVVLNAVWIKIDVNLNGGTSEQDFNNHVYAENLILLNPKKPGYFFNGWTLLNKNNNKTTQIGPNGKIDKLKNDVLLTANFSKINIDLNGGSTSQVFDDIIAGTPYKFNTPTYDGKIFAGWTQTNNCNENVATILPNKTFNVVKDCTNNLVAIWSGSVSLELNGGELVNDISFLKNISTKLYAPYKKGYIFDKWVIKDEKTNKSKDYYANSSYTSSGNPIIVTAIWGNQYSLDLKGGHLENNLIFANKTATTMVTPYNDKFIFKEWSIKDKVTLKTTTVKATKPYTPNGNPIEITAIWGDAVSVNLNEGRFTTLVSFVNGERITLPNPVREGYVFTGWNSIEDGVSKLLAPKSDFIPKKGFELIANWEPFSIELNGGSNGVSYLSSYAKNDKIKLPIPTKENSIFTGWIIDGVKKEAKELVFKFEKGSRIEAKWEPFNVNLNSSTTSVKIASSYAKGQNITLGIPNKEKHVFTGWTINGEDKGVGIKSYKVEDKTLDIVANFVPYEVDLNYGVTTAIKKQDYNKTYSKGSSVELVYPTRYSYVFTGWTVYDMTDNGEIATLTPSKKIYGFTETPVKIVANWYEYKVDLNGGETTAVKQEDYIKSYVDGNSISLTTPTRKEHVFTGWTVYDMTDNSEIVKLTPSTKTYKFPGKSVKIVANWYEYKVDLNGGETTTSYQTKYTSSYVDGNSISLTTPTRKEHVFTGWTVYDMADNNEIVTLTPSTKTYKFPGKSVKIVADWYEYKVDLNGGETTAAKQNDYVKSYVNGNSISLIIPTRKKHIFIGWTVYDMTDNSEIVTLTPSTKTYKFPGKSVMIVAKWTDFVYELNGGITKQKFESTSYYVGQTVSLTTPTLTGKKFDKWTIEYLSSDGTDSTLSKSSIKIGTKPFKLVANWK